MILGFLAAVGSAITSTAIIESVTAGVGLGISIYTASKCARQSGRTQKK
jgi:hypothetical protein